MKRDFYVTAKCPKCGRFMKAFNRGRVNGWTCTKCDKRKRRK